MGVINAVIVGILAYIPVYLITKLFKLNMNIYYDHKGNKITKQEYEKLDNKVDYGFSWFPKSRKRKN